MVKKVQAQMSTEVALDMLKASESIKSITTRVNSFTQSWKASEAQMKSAGDYVGAATAKYEGLGKSISAQQDKIAKLKKEQSELKGNTQETSQEYLKYQNQIDKATTKLSSLEAQQNRAKQSMEYQKSGLAGLQHSFELNNKAIQSHVERLQAEGKSEEAQVAKIKGLDTALENLTSQYKKQRTETIAAAREFGQTSDEYLKAKTRLNETATAMAKTKTQANELRESMEKKPVGFMVGVRSKLESINKKAEQTSHLFGKIVGANLVANGVINGLTTIQAHFTSLIEAGNEYNIEQDKMNATWLTLTGNASKGKAMVNTINELSVKTGQSTDLVNELEQGFYHLNSSKKQADGLTKSMLNMGDAVGLTGDQMKAVGQDMVHSMATGKLTAGELNQIGSYFPMIDEALAKHYNTTVAGMRKIVKSGKVTSATLQQVFEQLGNGKYDKAAQNMLQTVYGMTRTIKAQAPKLVADLEGPFETMRNPILGQVSKWVTDKSTQTLMSNFGKNIMTQFDRVVAAYGGKKINVTAGLDGAVKSASKMVTNFANLLIRHKKDIKEFFDSFKTGGATSFKIFVGVLKDMAIALKPLLDLMAKFPRTSAAMITSGLLISKTIKGIQLAVIGASAIKSFGSIIAFKDAESGAVKLGALGKAVKLFGQSFMTVGKFMLTNPFGIAITATALLTVGFAELYKHSKTFRDAMNKLGNTLKNVFIGSIKWVAEWGRNMKKGWSDAKTSTSKGVKDVGRFISNLVTSAGKNLSNLWNGTKSTFRNGWTDVTNASKSGAHNVGNWFGNMANDTRKKAIQMFNSHKAIFQSGYKVLNNYTQTWHDIMTGKWNKVGSDLRNTANSIRSFVHNIFSDMYNKLNQMTGGRLGDMVNAWKSKMSAIGNTVSDAKASIHKHFVDLVRGIIKPFNDMLSGLEKGINWVLDKVGASKISGDWSVSMPSYVNGTQDTHQGGLAKVNDGQGANYREMYHLPNGEVGMFPAVKNMIVPLPKGTSVLNGDKSAQLAKMMGIPGYAGGIGDFFSGLWSGAKDVLDSTEDILKKPAEFMESLFKHFMGGATSKVSLASDVLTHFPITVAKDAIDWVKKQFQSIANPTGAGVARWEPIIKAVAASTNFNISGSQVSKLLRQIQTESGGNPTALQKVHDINSASGHPAQGLLQFIPSTFASWALKGHTNILNGADQIMAAINALNHGGEGGWSNIGNGHGWENGGIVRNWQYAQIAEHNKPEAVIPLDSAKDSRAWQVLKAVVDAKTGGKSLDSNNTGSTSNADSKIAELTSTVNQMATMMKTIIGLNADQITATKGIGAFDQQKNYKQQALDLSKQNWTGM